MSGIAATLLAKRPRSPAAPEMRETLAGHAVDVVRTARTLVDGWGAAFLDAMALPADWLDRLQRCAGAAAALHDLGKANDQFQSMVRGQRAEPQAVRHEVVSAWLVLRHPALAEWLRVRPGPEELDAVIAAVLGHHLQASNDLQGGGLWQPRHGAPGTELDVLAGTASFRDATERIAAAAGLGSPPLVPSATLRLVSGSEPTDLEDLLLPWWQRYSRRWRRLPPDAGEIRFLALVKAVLVAADVAGSAVPRRGDDPAAWTRDVLSRTCSDRELYEVATARLSGSALRPFQGHVAATGARVSLVCAGCGSGKTTAAYAWGAHRAGGRKLFFCYPTTGTATEGFADYVAPASVEGRLIHGRAEVDLDRLLAAGDADDRDAWQPAFESLSAWDVPLVVCTADSVLGLVQNNRRGLFSFPAIAASAFVFDEVHAYDDRMFGALLRFVRTFIRAPILLMTASLPRARRDALRGALASEELAEIEGSPELEALARYRLRGAQGAEATEEASRVLASGGKVLWVANTVGRCMAFCREISDLGREPMTYHSRFRYADRVDRHRAVIDAFKKPGPALAVTTQVCEMSLDISADLLVTDLAPVPALIQRLGRLNRRATPDCPGEADDCLVLSPESPRPYEQAELDLGREWITRLGAGPLSQADLARAFEELAAAAQPDQVRSAWLDGGPVTEIAPLREGGATAIFLLAEDAADARRGRSERLRLELPMPIRPAAREMFAWPHVGPARVAPAGRIDYSPQWGARWSSGQ
ncbi:MAG: CRISPR-associated helicase Cas3' [Deltaproteobacteria bacterium]|nr:CRISPR-associated helicase Cas3' [Deltaproteobacteria bacterium]